MSVLSVLDWNYLLDESSEDALSCGHVARLPCCTAVSGSVWLCSN